MAETRDGTWCARGVSTHIAWGGCSGVRAHILSHLSLSLSHLHFTTFITGVGISTHLTSPRVWLLYAPHITFTCLSVRTHVLRVRQCLADWLDRTTGNIVPQSTIVEEEGCVVRPSRSDCRGWLRLTSVK